MRRGLIVCVVLAIASGCGEASFLPPSGAPATGRPSVPTAHASVSGPGALPTAALPTVGPGRTAGVLRNPTTPTLPTLELPQVTPLPTPPAGLDNFGAPSWVQPGTRVTFYDAAASVAQSNFAWVEDPTGNWTDPNTGIKYRRTDETGEGVPTASGDGLSQLDVIALDGTDVIVNDTLYGIDHNYNQFVLGPGTGGRVSGKEVDGTWIQPDLLAQLTTQNLGGLWCCAGRIRSMA